MCQLQTNIMKPKHLTKVVYSGHTNTQETIFLCLTLGANLWLITLQESSPNYTLLPPSKWTE